MRIELQRAGVRGRPNVRVGRLAITTFPPRDRGLPAAQPLAELVLTEVRAATSHEDQVSTSHTATVF